MLVEVKEATPLMELTQRIERLEEKVSGLSRDVSLNHKGRMTLYDMVTQLRSDMTYRLDNVTITLRDAPCE